MSNKNSNSSIDNSSIRIIDQVAHFWECDCISNQNNYIHPIDQKFCDRCGAVYSISRVITDAEEMLNYLTLG